MLTARAVATCRLITSHCSPSMMLMSVNYDEFLRTHQSHSAHSLFSIISIGLLTRNNSLDFELSHAKTSQKKLFHTIIRNFGYCCNYSPLTAMQISSGDPSLTTSNYQVITLDTFKKFLETRQIESKNEAEIKKIIEVTFFYINSLKTCG